jgi:hypothetical protein
MNDKQHMAIYRYNPMTGEESVLVDSGNPFAALICVSPDYEKIYFKTHAVDGDPNTICVFDQNIGTVSDIPEWNDLTDAAIQEKVLK